MEAGVGNYYDRQDPTNLEATEQPSTKIVYCLVSPYSIRSKSNLYW